MWNKKRVSASPAIPHFKASMKKKKTSLMLVLLLYYIFATEDLFDFVEEINSLTYF